MSISDELQLTVLLSSVIFVNWPLIFGLSVHIDSWIVCRWLHDKKFSEIYRFYNNVGIPLMAPLMISVWRLSKNNLHLSGLILLCLRIGHALAVYVIFKDLLNLGGKIAFVITLLTIIYPSQTYIYDFVVGLLYGISWPLFTIGGTIYFYSHTLVGENWLRILLICLAVVFVLFSFNMKSILLPALILNTIILNSTISVWPEKNIIDLALKIFMTALPIIYWITIENCYPRSNEYSKYNRFLSSSQIFKVGVNLSRGVSEALLGATLQALKLTKHPELCLLFITIVIMNASNFDSKFFDFSQLNSSILFLSGVVICLISLIPYALVGQEFDHKGYLTKNFILCDVSWALVVTSIFAIPFLQKIEWNLFFIFVIIILIYNITNQCKLWISYAKQCEIRYFISKIKTEVDLALIIDDLSSWTSDGKKSKFYPMTINFMANSYDQLGLIYFSSSKTNDIQDVLKTAVHHYYTDPLPTLKKNYKPQEAVQLVVEDNLLTIKNLFFFIVGQFRKDPFDIQSSSGMFRIKLIKI